MPAVPALVMAGGSIGGSLLANKAAGDARDSAAARTPAEKLLMSSQTNVANQSAKQGKEMYGAAMPGIKNTLGYYDTLLKGNRGARTAAASPEMQDTAEAYKGADTAITNSRMRGGERDQALAANATAKAGQIGRLVSGVRPGAAGAIANLGTNLVGASNASNNTAGGIFSGLLGNETQNRQQANEIGGAAGTRTAGSIGKLLADLLQQYGGGKGGGKSTAGLLPSRGVLPMTPSMYSMPGGG